MNIPKEIILNQLIKIPAVRSMAKVRHQTGISHCPELLNKYQQLFEKYADIKNKRVLELGPGKTLDLLLAVKKNGAASIAIADVEAYLTEEQIRNNSIEYTIYDGGKIPLPDESFDLIISTSVCEHLRTPALTVQETYRLLSPGGKVVHIIDLIDHFSYGTNDPTITFNCLKYPKTIWDLMTWNRSNYVNRLRASDWIELHLAAGFGVTNSYTESSDYIQANYKISKQLKYLQKYSEVDAVSTAIHLVGEK